MSVSVLPHYESILRLKSDTANYIAAISKQAFISHHDCRNTLLHGGNIDFFSTLMTIPMTLKTLTA